MGTVAAEVGDLAADFGALPACAELPDPLARELGGAAGGQAQPAHPAEWPAPRAALLQLFQRWVLGTVPPAPATLHATTLAEQRRDGAIYRRSPSMSLAHPRTARRFTAGLAVGGTADHPAGPGPFPVFVAQDNRRGCGTDRPAAGLGGAASSPEATQRDDTDGIAERFPGYDWSRLARRAWAARRFVDYLATMPEADGDRIVVAGRSRNGKLALIASALDERFAAVISRRLGGRRLHDGALPQRAPARGGN